MIEEIIKFEATDKIPLSGVLFKPKKTTKKVLIYLHGTGGSDVFMKMDFFSNFAKDLSKKNIGLLVFNNRGSHIVKKNTIGKGKSKKRFKTGSAFEIIEDSVKDIDGAVKFLKTKKFNKFFLMGHSTGANKICIYDHKKKKNEISKYILFAGGDDTGLVYEEFGKKKFDQILNLSAKRVEQGRGEETVEIEGFYVPIVSYKSLFDVMNPDGDYNTFPFYEILNGLEISKNKKLFYEYEKISKPSLVVIGDKDEYCFGEFGEIKKILERYSNENHKFFFVKGANHSFDKKEKILFKNVTEWLSK